MFKAPFSFQGRITRTEYFYSFLLSFLVLVIGMALVEVGIGAFIVLGSMWFMLVQSWKRSHDAGWYGIISLIPYVNIALFFVSGDEGANQYGPNPRLVGASTNRLNSVMVPPPPPPLPSAWERARSEDVPSFKPFKLSSFKCTACGAQNTDVEHQGTACCQFCGAPRA